MHLSELVFKRKAIFYFLLICIAIGGVLSFDQISKLEDPEITVMIAKVITVYPGASAHEVEMKVTDVLEKEINALSDINSILSKSSANVSIIDVELKMTVPQKEIEQRWEFLRRKIDLALPKLPDGCQTPLVLDDFGDVYGMFYAMTADGYSYEEMSDQANYLKREMLAIEGVSKVQIYGEQKPCIDIIIDADKMSQLGVFPIQLISALSGINSTVYPGNLELDDQRLRVSVDEQSNTLADIQNLMIKGLDENLFKLSDIATIKKGYNTPLTNTFALNNDKALAVSISMESGENIIKIGDKVEKRMGNLIKNLPAGFKIKKVFFQPDKVKDAIHGFMFNLIASVLIVVIVLMITMGLRSGIIIGSGLIFTILATFPLLLVAGGTLQRISLGAFIVAMGMLVDNAIVVIDGILVDLQKGRRTKKAFVNSAKRTALPLLGATIIAVAAFLPAVLSKDTAGTYVHDLFVVLCISLLVSWLLAIMQVPLFSAFFLKVKKTKKGESNPPFQGKMYDTVRHVLSFLMNYKKTTIAVAVVALLFAAYNFKNVKQTFFPDFNYNQSYIEYKLPEETNPDRVNADLQKITEYFLSYPEINMVATSHGASPTRYCLVRAIGEMSNSYGELIVNFDNYDSMIRLKPELENYLRNNYPDAYIRIRKYNLSIKSSHTVEAEFSGPDPAVLKDLSAQAQQIMLTNSYVDDYTVCDDWNAMGKTMTAEFDQNTASLLGTTRQDVSNALLAATDGLPITKLYEGQRPFTINLKTRNADGSKITDLSDVPVWNMLPSTTALNEKNIMGIMQGTKSVNDITKEIISPVPLSAVTYGVNLHWEESMVRRVNGTRTIQAQCEPANGYSPALVRQSILNEIESIELPEGYSMQWMGEYELQGTALKNIFSYLPIALMIIVLTLILLFNDFKKPLIVILCIPMAIIGIVPGLILTGMPFTFIAIIGSLGLIGMLIKNSIVLIDEIEKQIKEGVVPYHAVINATVSRTRPVIMASFTTILGMLPLFGDPMYASMAATVISGLLIGTLITLIFVPILYALFFNIHKNTAVNNL